MKTPWRGTPIFVQVLALIVVCLAASYAITSAIVLHLPPPPPEIYRLSDVARALRSPGVTPVPEARPLVVSLQGAAPREQALLLRGNRWRDDVRKGLAEALQVDPSRIAIETDGPRRMFMRTRQVETSFEVHVFRGGAMMQHDPDDHGPPPGAVGPGARSGRTDAVRRAGAVRAVQDRRPPE